MSQESAVQVVKDEAETPKPGKRATAVVKKVASKPRAAKKPAPEMPAEATAAKKAAPKQEAATKSAKKAAPKTKSKAVEAPKAEKAVKEKKQAPKKPKLIRDSFTFPEGDYALFASLKQRALAAGIEVKKSELLRAALALLANMADRDFAATIGLVERIKTGRPKR